MSEHLNEGKHEFKEPFGGVKTPVKKGLSVLEAGYVILQIIVAIFVVWLESKIPLAQQFLRDLGEEAALAFFLLVPVIAGSLVSLLALGIHRAYSGRKVAAIATAALGECIAVALLIVLPYLMWTRL